MLIYHTVLFHLTASHYIKKNFKRREESVQYVMDVVKYINIVIRGIACCCLSILSHLWLCDSKVCYFSIITFLSYILKKF